MRRCCAVMLLVLTSGGLAAAGADGGQELRTPPRPSARVKPDFPDKAGDAGLEGDVTFRAMITADGTVSDVTIIGASPTGFGFEESVLNAVRRWRFTAAVADGHPVQAQYTERLRVSPDSPRHKARMYGARSKVAWEAVQRVLKDAGVKSDKTDRNGQVLLTRWTDVDARHFGDAAARVAGAVGRRARLHVYVSPFKEPARVYVGTVEEGPATTQGDSVVVSTLYNAGILERWLLDRLDAALGSPGQFIPDSPVRRAERARILMNTDGEDSCHPSMWSVSGRFEQPVKNPTSDEHPRYPFERQQARDTGAIRLAGLLREDGALVGLSAAEEGRAPEFYHAAIGAASLWRFRPGRVDGCPVVVPTTLTVNFLLESDR